jgi:hypothetical protein
VTDLVTPEALRAAGLCRYFGSGTDTGAMLLAAADRIEALEKRQASVANPVAVAIEAMAERDVLRAKLAASEAHHEEHHAREERMRPICVLCESQPHDSAPCGCAHAPCVHDTNLARKERDTALARLKEAEAMIDNLRAEINTPELYDFGNGVVREAQHQRSRWGSEHDSGKEPSDWFWLVGYLAGKCLASHLAGHTEKAMHHAITAAAALGNWHAAILGKTESPVQHHISVLKPGRG